MLMGHSETITSYNKKKYYPGLYVEFLNNNDSSNVYNWDLCHPYTCNNSEMKFKYDAKELSNIYNYNFKEHICEDVCYSIYAIHEIENNLAYTNPGTPKEPLCHFLQDTIKVGNVDTIRKWGFYEFSNVMTDSITGLDSQSSLQYLFMSDNLPYPHTSLMHHRSLMKSDFLSRRDISQCYYHITLDFPTEAKGSSLLIDFGDAVELSNIDPTPDSVSMSSILYVNNEKLKRIRDNGLWIHAIFKHLENKQIIRMFLISTALSFFVALFFSSLWKFFVVRSRRFRLDEFKKQQQSD